MAIRRFEMRQEDCKLRKIYLIQVETPADCGTAMQLFAGVPNCELSFNGPWWPSTLSLKSLEDREKMTHAIRLMCCVDIGNRILRCF